ncbi:MAG: hypothetical protein Kow0080_03230 [Candidatus Promineifilaceae bacterium]
MRRFFLLVLLIIVTACGSSGGANLDAPDVLFHDEFTAGSSGSWLLEGDDLGQTAVINDALHIEVNAANTLQYVTLTDPIFDDFTLDVDATILAGSPDSTYGILFRMQGNQQFYRFEILGTGKFMLEKRNADGTWTRLLNDWTAHEAILPGLNSTNHLRVEANGPNIAIYANDQLLYRAVDTAYTVGTIALDAGTFGQPGVRIVFDNLVVRKP